VLAGTAQTLLDKGRWVRTPDAQSIRPREIGMITFSCTSCGKVFTVQDGQAGRRAKCLNCQAVMTIPGPAPIRPVPAVQGEPTMEYRCPACKAPLTTPRRLAGQQDVCPQCGEQHAVPASAPRHTGRNVLVLALLFFVLAVGGKIGYDLAIRGHVVFGFADRPSTPPAERQDPMQTSAARSSSPGTDSSLPQAARTTPKNTSDAKSLPMGNGVIISPDGHILTLASLVRGRKVVPVMVRDKPLKAEVVAVDASLDLAVLKVPGTAYAKVTLCDSGRSVSSDGLCVIGCAARHRSDGKCRQDDAALFSRFGPAALTKLPHVLRLNGPANPALAGSGVFDLHGDVIGLVTTRSCRGPMDAAQAVDIRAAIGFLKKHNVPFSVGGAPMTHELGELHRLVQHAIVPLVAPVKPGIAPVSYAPCQPVPARRFAKGIPFLGRASAYSPNGKTIAVVRCLGSGSSNRSEILLLDADTGEKRSALTGQMGHAGTLQFSPNGKFLLSVVPPLGFSRAKKPAFLWNVENGAIWCHLPQAHDGSFSPDGSLIALRVGWQGRSWRLGSPKASDNVAVVIHRADTGKQCATIVPGKYGLCGEIYQCVFLPKSGNLLTAGFWYDLGQKQFQVLHVWDPKTGKLLKQLTIRPAIEWPKHGYLYGAVSVSPDERTLVLRRFRDGKTIPYAEIIDFPSMKPRYTIAGGATDWLGHHKAPWSAVSPAGDLVLMADPGVGFLDSHMRAYDLASGTYLWLFNGTDPVMFSPDGRRLVQVRSTGVVSWDLPTAARRSGT